MASTSQILQTIQQHESIAAAAKLGVSPYALTPEQNSGFPSSHASGAYQFQPATWQTYTAQSGIGTQYQQAYQAPPQVQDAVAAWVVQNKGTNDWSPYSGALPALTNANLDPQQIASGDQTITSSGTFNLPEVPNYGDPFGTPSLPDTFAQSPDNNFDTGLTPPTGNFDPGSNTALIPPAGSIVGGALNFNPNSDILGSLPDVQGDLSGNLPTSGGLTNPITGSANPFQGGANSQWWQNLLKNISDLSIRGGLGLLALVLIGAAAWAFANGGFKPGAGAIRKLAQVHA